MKIPHLNKSTLAITILVSVLVATIIGLTGLKIKATNSNNKKLQTATQLMPGETIIPLLKPFTDQCLSKNGTFTTINPPTPDNQHNGAGCYIFSEEPNQPKNLILELSFPALKEQKNVLIVGFYKGTCTAIKELVYPLTELKNGNSTTTLPISIEDLRKNTDANPANGWLVLAVSKQLGNPKPLSCQTPSF